MIAIVVPVGASVKEASRPNVLFIAVDNLRAELGCCGATHLRSPNVDAFTATALRFDRAYCQQAVCNPSPENFSPRINTSHQEHWPPNACSQSPVSRETLSTAGCSGDSIQVSQKLADYLRSMLVQIVQFGKVISEIV